MSQNKSLSLSRRNFLKTSLLAGGGMLIGFNFLSACKPEAILPIDISNLNFNDFNAFIKISDEGYITIFSPNPEIGQGVKTSMPMIIAEELDVAWEKVSVAQGFYDPKNYQRQVAGGSQSIRFGWDALRQTGATTKQMLVNAAAIQWGVEPNTCFASQGIITNANGDTLGYGEVVKVAANLEVPENINLKDPKDFKIIGHDIINVDIQKIITGDPLFGIDYSSEGMVYASVLRPPAFGNKLARFDDKITKSINGVTEVIKFGDKIAVLGSNTWAVMKGKKALVAHWETDTKLESTDDHNFELFKILNGNKFETNREDGNVESAFKDADKIIERT